MRWFKAFLFGDYEVTIASAIAIGLLILVIYLVKKNKGLKMERGWLRKILAEKKEEISKQSNRLREKGIEIDRLEKEIKRMKREV